MGEVIVDGVSKTYIVGRRGRHQIPAISDISMRVGGGEFVSVIGPSGCGKTTLLRLIAGLATPSSGAVELRGSDGVRAEMGIVFQTPALFPWMRVGANIMAPARFRGQDLAVAAERMHALLEVTGLTGFVHVWPHELSQGMAQRVALCRALLLRPEVLLLDEPFSALDPMTRESLDLFLAETWAHEPITTVLVTHSMSEAVLLSDRVMVLSTRPAVVVAEVSVELPRPRRADLIGTDAFTTCERLLRRSLQPGTAIEGSRTSG